ncbi:hypothetical protein [uncultured Tateyamaria sp.]|uniref:hypothetical protein n=1 Tax=uncultured Tateyamaria sp. TaxID=455651 RepID=UPI0026233139|nr:hypothetical protein [uncultured Tateyamaria sp.]
MKGRFLATCCALTIALVVQATAQGAPRTAAKDPKSISQCILGNPQARLRVGVRHHARPFSYHSSTLNEVLTAATPGPLAASNYTGYVVKICDAVLNEMRIGSETMAPLQSNDVSILDIDCAQSASLGEAGSRFRFINGSEKPLIDVLCDPATITNDRRTGMMISAPIYLTGVSYITPKNMQRPRVPSDDGHCPSFLPPGSDKIFHLFGMVGNTTAAGDGVRAVLDADELPNDRDALIEFLKETDKCSGAATTAALETGIQGRGPVRFFRTHAEAARAFCNQEIYYYVGDREIITANAASVPGCDFDNGTRTFTTDRYAIFGRIDYNEKDRALLVARFFEVLSQKIVSHPSILDQAFYDTFHPTRPTDALDFFFRSVRGAP